MELIYIILLIVAGLMFIGITVTGCASALYKKTIKDNLDKNSSIGKSAGEFTKTILEENGISAQVIRVPSLGIAHYDYQNKVVALSDNVYSSFSSVAQAIAMHEVGHAIQDKTNSRKFNVFKKLNLASRILAPLFWISFVVGLICLFAIDYEPLYAYVIFGISGLCMILDIAFKCLTYSMEKEASNLAEKILKENNLSEDEFRSARAIYKIALTTYFASLFKPVIDLFNGITWVIFNTIGRLFR